MDAIASESFLGGVKVDFHDHFVFPTNMLSVCYACHNSEEGVEGQGGYICKPCGLYIHKACIEITNPYRHKHPLKLLQYNPVHECDKKCFSCEQRLSTRAAPFPLKLFYHCFICDISVCNLCPSKPLVIDDFPKKIHEFPLTLGLVTCDMDAIASESFLGGMKVDFHEHLVYPTNILSVCYACHNAEEEVEGQGGYICNPCDLYVHKACIEINNPYRHKHPLKLLQYNPVHECDKKCLSCEQRLHSREDPPLKLFYHCFICDISLCNLCPSLPLVIDDIPKKIHEHSLTQVMIKVSFTCDACGICGDGLPCVCLQCCFIIHRDCTKLPRVIHINRHEHRVSHTYSLGPGDWVCGVCREDIDRLYGAYSCSICRYAVHSKCAKRKDVWDKVELEDVSEDDNDDLDPFEVISKGVIDHFSHEHHLRLIDGNHESVNDGNKHCYACTFPIYYDPCYACEKCHFILHETCANLSKKKRHEVHSRQLTLDGNLDDFSCNACQRICTGFRYRMEEVYIDVCCAMVSKTFNHGSHQHPLFFLSISSRHCAACREYKDYAMSCIECNYNLCFTCATLPKEVIRHKHDQHPLSLCYGEDDASGLYWCEICEAKVNPKEWFYTCSECGPTLHVRCVLGNFVQVRPGHVFTSKVGELFEVVANNRPTRPFCSVEDCRRRCIHDFVLQSMDYYNTYACDPRCLMENKR